MIGTLVIGARVKITKVHRRGTRIDLNFDNGTVEGFSDNGNVKVKLDGSGKVRQYSSDNLKVIK